MAKKVKNHIDPEKIHLLKIDCVDVSIGELESPFKKDETIGVKIAHLSAYNLEDKGYLLGLDLLLNLPDREPEKIARFRYDFHFVVDNLEEMYGLQEDGKPIFKIQFAATLAGISYSTLRGIIFEKLLQSSWGSITVPVINPSIILESWIET